MAEPVADRVVFFGRFGAPSLAFARSCAALGVRVYLLTPGGGGTSRCLADVAALRPGEVLAPQGISAIAAYVRGVGAHAVAAIEDAHCIWLARNRQAFGPECTVMLPPAECLELLASKANQIAIARQVGMQVLPTFELRGPEDADTVPDTAFPVCLRPVTASRFRVAVARSRDELRARDYSCPLLAQPLKRLPNLLVHAAGGDVAAFLVDRKFEGITLRIHRYPMPAGLADQVRAFAASVGLSGAHHFEFLFSPASGECYFLEVNPRFGGTTDKVRLLGFDEAALCLAGYGLRTPRPQPMSAGRQAVANKRALVRHIWSMLRRASDPWDYPAEPRWKGIFRSLVDLAATRDSVWDWRDLSGTGAYHLRRPGIAPGRLLS